MTNKLTKLIILCATLFALALGAEKSFAQPPPGGGPGAGPGQGPGGPGGGNFDPKQFQQQMMQRVMKGFRDQLVVTNDDEWNVIEPRLTKVVQLRFETMMSGMGGMRGMGGKIGRAHV